jgi:hypothetical protein
MIDDLTAKVNEQDDIIKRHDLLLQKLIKSQNKNQDIHKPEVSNNKTHSTNNSSMPDIPSIFNILNPSSTNPIEMMFRNISNINHGIPQKTKTKNKVHIETEEEEDKRKIESEEEEEEEEDDIDENKLDKEIDNELSELKSTNEDNIIVNEPN